MEIGVQCSLGPQGSDHKNFLIRLEERIIENQKSLFLKTDKMLRFQNEKIVKLTKLVDVQNETIGTLDARLDIIYRFLNKEIKDMEGRMMSRFDFISTSFTNQFVYSVPYALSPAMEALTNIQKKLEVLCRKDVFDISTIAVSELDIACSETLDPVSEDIAHYEALDPVSEISEQVDEEHEYVEGGEDLSVCKSERIKSLNEIFEVNSNLVEKHDELSNETSNNNIASVSSTSENTGLKFILKSLGLPGGTDKDCEIDNVKIKVTNKADDAIINEEKNLKRKHEKEVLVDLTESHNDATDEDLEDGEIVDDEQGVSVVPIGRVTVRTSGIFKDETMHEKKRKKSRKRKC